jgi:hypothetical protein
MVMARAVGNRAADSGGNAMQFMISRPLPKEVNRPWPFFLGPWFVADVNIAGVFC